MTERVWYVAYGSNLRLARFGVYLAGGCPDGGSHEYPGCRDGSEPADVAAVELTGGLYFAGESAVWGGGVAFFDATVDGSVAARAYLLTVGQFSDVVAQERKLHPAADLDLSSIADAGRAELGPGRYESVVYVGKRDGLPMLTFTATDHSAHPLAAPAPAYLWSITAGLREAHGWDPVRIGAYLAAVPGAAERWTAQEIAALAELDGPPG